MHRQLDGMSDLKTSDWANIVIAFVAVITAGTAIYQISLLRKQMEEQARDSKRKEALDRMLLEVQLQSSRMAGFAGIANESTCRISEEFARRHGGMPQDVAERQATREGHLGNLIKAQEEMEKKVQEYRKITDQK